MERFDAFRGIVARGVDKGRNGIHLHQVRRIVLIEGLQLFRGGHHPIDPEFVLFRVEDENRHSVVEGLNQTQRALIMRLLMEGSLAHGGNEPPTHEGGPIAGFRSPDGQDLLSGRDVVAR